MGGNSSSFPSREFEPHGKGANATRRRQSLQKPKSITLFTNSSAITFALDLCDSDVAISHGRVNIIAMSLQIARTKKW